MDANAEKLAAAFEDDATAELFEDAPPRIESDAPQPPSALAFLSSPSPAPATESPAPKEPAPGVVLRERYVLEQPLAAGGTAIVYRARDLRREAGGGLIALKFLRPERRGRAHAIESLRREFQYAQSLSHPNIARVFDLDCDAGLWFMTLELLEGETLGALLKRPDELMPPRRALDILRACAEALAFAHERGVAHGDFKPGNVFIPRNGAVRVFDFGAAAASWRPGDARVPAATPPYASPQVLAGERPERRDDVFSFACVAYELLNGRHPFGRRSALEARAANLEVPRAWNLSPRQWHALEEALAWEREQRPATLRALLSDLSSSEVPPPLEIPEITPEARTFRAPTLAPIATVLALAILGVSALGLAYSRLNDRANATLHPVIGEPSAKPLPAQETPRAEAPPQSSRAALPPPPDKKPEAAKQPQAPATSAPPAPTRIATASSGTARRITGAPAFVTLDTPSVQVSEGAVSAVLRMSRSQQLSGRVQVKWHTQSGSAAPGGDFLPVVSGTAGFADGQITRAIYIPLVNDRLAERDETFKVEVYVTDDSARVFPTAIAQVTILDDDREPPGR